MNRASPERPSTPLAALGNELGLSVCGPRVCRGRYGLLRGEAIAARAEAAIASSQSVVFRRGLAVTGIHAVPGGTRVETPEGRLTASLVIDTRPGGAELMNRGAWVRTGVRAEVHTGSACFEAGTAHLVHRLRRDGQSLAFETILPHGAGPCRGRGGENSAAR